MKHKVQLAQFESLSARRAWIEMSSTTAAIPKSQWVALRKESVDRNLDLSTWNQDKTSRSPQGERG